jgi:GntR family transcriptional regulator
MYITIDERDKRPLYQQVVDEIKGLIARGELDESSTLPPVRQVAADLGVNLNTIAFAYRQLQQEGLIRVKHGSGATVISRVLAKRDQERAQEQLLAVLTDLVLSGLTRSEVLALVNKALNGLKREQRSAE